MSESQRPRVRVRAGSDAPRPGVLHQLTETSDLKARTAGANRSYTTDNFVNYQAQLGYATNNIASGGTYGFNPISRLRTLLEWAYRGSWIVRQVVDAPADDMTREGINIESPMDPRRIEQMEDYWVRWKVWDRLNETLKWARLYGGAMAYIAIDGQDPSTPLRVETVRKGQFKGLLVLDRWMVYPSVDDPVREYGLDFGKPKFYTTVADARSIPRMKIHHTRMIRFDGNQLPYFQRLSENEWGISVIETLWDRLLAFDSATQGAAQLVYRAHLRVISIEGFRNLVAEGGPMYTAFIQYVQMMRAMQTNEGVTVMDSQDTFQAHQYAFSGLSDMLVQFSQQISGAAQVPLVRLFGQSPAGFGSTGESELRNYYDFIKAQQKTKLHSPLMLIFDLCSRSLWNEQLPDEFGYSFASLWQETTTEKFAMAAQITQTVTQAIESGLVSQKVAMKELKQSSRETGVWSNITDQDIAMADDQIPPPPGAQTEGEIDPETGQPIGAVPGMAPNGPGVDAEGEPAGQAPDPHSSAGVAAAAQAVMAGNHGAGTLHRISRLLTDPEDYGQDLLAQPDDELEAGLGDERTGGEEGVELETGEVNSDPGSPLQQAADQVRNLYDAGGADGLARAAQKVIALIGDNRGFVRDSLPMLDVHGLNVVIETPKDTKREGYGWSVQMPAHYGYISGTSSMEGPTEQMDAFVGPEPDSELVWVVEQCNPDTKAPDEHKILLNFGSEDEALGAYKAAFNDGRGADRILNVRRMHVDVLKQWLQRWRYGDAPQGR